MPFQVVVAKLVEQITTELKFKGSNTDTTACTSKKLQKSNKNQSALPSGGGTVGQTNNHWSFSSRVWTQPIPVSGEICEKLKLKVPLHQQVSVVDSSNPNF